VAETLAEPGRSSAGAQRIALILSRQVRDAVEAYVARVVETELPLIYLNMVGGQDDPGSLTASFALNPGGQLAFFKCGVLTPADNNVDLEQTVEAGGVSRGEGADAIELGTGLTA